MKVKNISTSTVYLSFVPISLLSGETKEIQDSFINHPQMINLLNAPQPVIQVVEAPTTASTSTVPTLTQTQKDALDRAANPSATNPVVTKSHLQNDIVSHSKDTTVHHSNSNDPSTNQKEAMDNADNPSAINSFSTASYTGNQITAAIAQHVIDEDHNPTPLTPDEVAAIHASTAPSAGNPMSTNSWSNSTIASEIGTHASDADAHHDNSYDPTSAQKDAMDNADAPAAGNPFAVASDLTTHTADVDAHHDNSNDPSFNQKQAMDNSSPAATGSNPFVTNNDSRIPSADQKGAMTNASPTPTSANPFVTDSDTRLDITNRPTTDEKEAMTNASPAPTAVNPFVTDGDSRLITETQALGISNATPAVTGTNYVITINHGRLPAQDYIDAMTNASPVATSGNPFVTDSDTRLDVTNRPTTDQKAAMTNASPAPTAANPFVTDGDARLLTSDQKSAADNADTPSASNPFAVESDITTHTADVDAHHDNSYDPTSAQKDAMDNASPAATGANPFVTDSDTRMTDSRDPNVHASNHTDGTDDIQNASNSQKGLMTAAFAGWVEDSIKRLNEVLLERDSGTPLTVLSLGGQDIYVNGEIINLATPKTRATTDNLIDGTGADASVAMSTSTLYYVYLSNASASPFPGQIRASTTAPSWDTTNKKYALGTSGNAQNWAFVGWVRTDGSTQFPDNFSVASQYMEPVRVDNINGSGTVSASSDGTPELITGLTKDMLVPEGWIVAAAVSVPMSHSSTSITAKLYFRVNTTNNILNKIDTGVASSYYALAGGYSYKESSSTPTYYAYSAYHEYSTALGSTTDAISSCLSLQRIPLK